MCFSAEASFAGGVIITAIAVVTIAHVHKPSQYVFACIPLFFGIQQITEGFLWVALTNPGYLNLLNSSMYLFLIMALVLWPFMVPLSVLLMEEMHKKRKILRVFLGIGFALSVYYAFCLIAFHVTPKIDGFHIQYVDDFPKPMKIIGFLVYLIASITPLFISSIKRTHLLGILMTLSCLVTGIFFTQYLTSVWCFFAALISGVILWILRDSKKRFKLDKIISFNFWFAAV